MSAGANQEKARTFFWKMLHEQNKKVDRENTFLIHILRHVPQWIQNIIKKKSPVFVIYRKL